MGFLFKRRHRAKDLNERERLCAAYERNYF